MERGGYKHGTGIYLQIGILYSTNNQRVVQMGGAESGANDLQLILCTALGIFLLAFLFLLHLTHHMAFTITMHFRLVAVHAKIFGNVVTVQLILRHYQHFAEGLAQYAYQ